MSGLYARSSTTGSKSRLPASPARLTRSRASVNNIDTERNSPSPELHSPSPPLHRRRGSRRKVQDADISDESTSQTLRDDDADEADLDVDDEDDDDDEEDFFAPSHAYAEHAAGRFSVSSETEQSRALSAEFDIVMDSNTYHYGDLDDIPDEDDFETQALDEDEVAAVLERDHAQAAMLGFANDLTFLYEQYGPVGIGFEDYDDFWDSGSAEGQELTGSSSIALAPALPLVASVQPSPSSPHNENAIEEDGYDSNVLIESIPFTFTNEIDVGEATVVDLPPEASQLPRPIVDEPQAEIEEITQSHVNGLKKGKKKRKASDGSIENAVSTSPRKRRRGPPIGEWFADPTKPYAVLEPSGSVIIINLPDMVPTSGPHAPDFLRQHEEWTDEGPSAMASPGESFEGSDVEILDSPTQGFATPANEQNNSGSFDGARNGSRGWDNLSQEDDDLLENFIMFDSSSEESDEDSDGGISAVESVSSSSSRQNNHIIATTAHTTPTEVPENSVAKIGPFTPKPSSKSKGKRAALDSLAHLNTTNVMSFRRNADPLTAAAAAAAAVEDEYDFLASVSSSTAIARAHLELQPSPVFANPLLHGGSNRKRRLRNPYSSPSSPFTVSQAGNADSPRTKEPTPRALRKRPRLGTGGKGKGKGMMMM